MRGAHAVNDAPVIEQWRRDAVGIVLLSYVILPVRRQNFLQLGPTRVRALDFSLTR